MTAAASVTTVLPSYNHADYVAEAVESVWAQDYPNHELVAIDDGSADGSAEILRRLAAESPIPMRVVAREDNRGLSATLNEGIAMSQAPYINIFASDDRLTPNKLTDLVGALEAADAGTGLAFGDRRIIDTDGRTLREAPPRYRPSGARTFYDVLTRRIFIPAPAVVYRREVFDAVGGFREGAVLEDWEMFLRITDRFEIVHVPRVVVEYRAHPGQVNRVHVEQIARERLAVFDSWVARAAELRQPARLRAARASVYKQTAKTYYGVRRLPAARRWMWRSLRHEPLALDAWLLLTKMLVESARRVPGASAGRRQA